MENYRHLTLEQLPEVLKQMQSFTLLFQEDEGTKKELTWIADQTLVNAFKKAIDFKHATPAYISAKAIHYGFIKTKEGHIYRFGLYNIDSTKDGFLIVGGRPVPLYPLMRDVIKKSFGLKTYSSLHHFFKVSEENEDKTDSKGKDHNTGYPLPTLKQYQYTVIFYSDNRDSDHNQKFAEKYRELHETDLKKVLIFEAKTPKQVGEIKSKIKSGKIRRILYSVHGLEAIFDTKYTDGISATTSVGLYPKNTEPKTFATYINELGSLMEDDASLLLLSCQTAGEVQYKKSILNGKEILTTLATDANLTVYSADSDVFITVDPPNAKIEKGAIYYARPGESVANVYGSKEFPISTSLVFANEEFEALLEEEVLS